MATALTGSGKENVWQFTIEAADRNAYLNSDGDVEIKFSVADADKPATRLNYTILLDPVYVSTDTTITKFTLNSAASPNVQLGETVIQADDIYFTVPYDNAPDVAGTQYRIRELELASATATVSLSRDTGMGATEIYYTTEATTQKIITDGNPNVTIQDGDTMTITNNGSTKNYTIHITSAPGFVVPLPPRRLWIPCCSPIPAILPCCCPGVIPTTRALSPSLPSLPWITPALGSPALTAAIP